MLTGETGAGKSIVVDALTLLCGARADADQIRAGADRADIAATFDIRQAPAALREQLEEQSIEADDELLVRRVINADGRSRAYLNGQAVAGTCSCAKSSAACWTCTASMNSSHWCGRPCSASCWTTTASWNRPPPGWAPRTASGWRCSTRCWRSNHRLRDRDARIELLRFQDSELTALDLKPGEAAELAAESVRLSNRGRLVDGTQIAAQLLYEGEEDTAQARIAPRAVGPAAAAQRRSGTRRHHAAAG